MSTIEVSLTAPQYGRCQGLFVAHTSVAVTVLQIHFHSHGLVKAYSSQGIGNMATATFQVCSQLPSIELQDIQTTGKQDKATYCTIKLKVT